MDNSKGRSQDSAGMGMCIKYEAPVAESCAIPCSRVWEINRDWVFSVSGFRRDGQRSTIETCESKSGGTAASTAASIPPTMARFLRSRLRIIVTLAVHRLQWQVQKLGTKPWNLVPLISILTDSADLDIPAPREDETFHLQCSSSSSPTSALWYPPLADVRKADLRVKRRRAQRHRASPLRWGKTGWGTKEMGAKEIGINSLLRHPPRHKPVFKHHFRRTLQHRENSTSSNRSSEVGYSQGELRGCNPAQQSGFSFDIPQVTLSCLIMA